MSLTDVAFAAGFGSVRQFNDTIREVFATSPTDLRTAARRTGPVPATSSPRAATSPGERDGAVPRGGVGVGCRQAPGAHPFAATR